MYLSHHYAVDLVAGAIISSVVYMIAKAKFLPRPQPGKMFRWDYDYVEYGEAPEPYAYGQLEFDEENYPVLHGDSDEWTIGSSSSFSNSSRSPSNAGLRSPIGNEDSWEGDTLASASDNEYQKA